ncbi:MAG: nucleotidyltransferase family protein, partial [Actinomycetota bacterium]|nr:nucleotidyltransferase family protein [Actinomycetota bacterium]
VLVRNEDIDAAVAALGRVGFEAGERFDWLRKAYRHGVLVDLITSVRRGIGLDPEVIAHARRSSYLGIEVTIPAPEDLVLIAAVSAHPETPDHWFTGRKLLAEVDIDWDYLRERSALAPLRMASLLLYCRSDDVAVPETVLGSLLVH